MSSKSDGAEKIEKTFYKILNFAQIYAEDQKVIFRSFFRTKNLTTFRTFEHSKHENLSQIFFPDKAKNLEGFPLKVVFTDWDLQFIRKFEGFNVYRGDSHIEILFEELNMTDKASSYVLKDIENWQSMGRALGKMYGDLISNDEMDIHAALARGYGMELNCYQTERICFLAPLPETYSIYEQVLILPLDGACWFW